MTDESQFRVEEEGGCWQLEYAEVTAGVRDLAVTLPALGNLELHRWFGAGAEAQTWGLTLAKQALCDLGT